MHAADPEPARRTDLDWLRVAAFGVLIFYHVGMFYVTWGWHVKSVHAGPGIEPAMLIANPWRLDLLFLISGVATRFMADRQSAWALAGSRTRRLFLPLAFGVLVVVPPQTYFQVVEQAGYSGDFGDFYTRYLTATGGWIIEGDPLITPTYNHLWFVAYLLVYSLVIVIAATALRRLPWRWAAGWARGPAFLVWPWVFLAAMRLGLAPAFPVTHAFIDDWYTHGVSFAAFALGFAVGKSEQTFATAVTWRWVALAIAVVAYAVRMTWIGTIGDQPPEGASMVALVALREAQAWFAIVALLGFARRHLSADTPRFAPLRRLLSQAVFPAYLVHQTVIVCVGFWLTRQGLPAWLEGACLIGATVVLCAGAYCLARVLGPFGLIFGLAGQAQKAKPVAPAPSASHL